jgi:hypothetical protein
MAKKATVKITGLGQARDNALKFLNESKKDSKILNTEGQFTADQIRNRTAGRQEEYKQNDLKNVTVEARKIYAGFYDTSPLAIPKRSNLTLTGQLLGAIKHKVNSAASEIIIYLTDNRRNRKIPDSIIQEMYDGIIDKDRNATNSKRKNPKVKDKLTAIFLLKNQKDKTNNEIRKDLEDKGRRFMFLSDRLKATLEARLVKELKRRLAIYNKIRRKLSL